MTTSLNFNDDTDENKEEDNLIIRKDKKDYDDDDVVNSFEELKSEKYTDKKVEREKTRILLSKYLDKCKLTEELDWFHDIKQ